MAVSNPVMKSFKTASDMSSADYICVYIDGADNRVVDAVAASAPICGIRQTSPNGSTNETEVTVAIAGIAKATVGTTGVTRGAYVTAEADGVTDTVTNTDNYVGIALSSGSVGEVVDILVKPGTISAT